MANKFVNWTLPNPLPKRVIDRLIAKQLDFTRHWGTEEGQPSPRGHGRTQLQWRVDHV
jgi:hypothetical protein